VPSANHLPARSRHDGRSDTDRSAGVLLHWAGGRASLTDRSVPELERQPVIHCPRAVAALLVALLLSAAAPAAIQAADAARPDATVAGITPLDTNILRNGGFEAVSTEASIPGWTVQGDVRVETFGSRPWPYPAYRRKWGGGKRYLAGRKSGLVRQTVDFTGWSDRTFKLRAHLQADFGGQIGHSIRVTIRATGSGPDKVVQTLKPLIITNHYKRAVATLGIPIWTDHLEATVELVGTDGGAKCRMVADTIKLIILRP
jgi:hypothetical protein